MEDYAKLYHLLFNAITDALEQMNAQNFGSAKETLVSAQQKQKKFLLQQRTEKEAALSAASEAMPPPQNICRQSPVTRASRSKARLISVTIRRDPWRSHVHRTRFRRPRSSSSLNLAM